MKFRNFIFTFLNLYANLSIQGGFHMDSKTEKVKAEILKNYKSIREFSKISEIPYTTLKSALDRGIGGTAVETVIKICNILNLDLQTFEPNQISTHSNCSMNEEQTEIMNKYKKLDKHGKEIVDIILDKEYERVKSLDNVIALPLESEPEHICGTLNLSDLKASAGTGNFLSEESMTPIQVDFNRLTAKADFAVPVEGDSMLPKYKDGDILLIQKQPSINVGEIGIFIIDGKGYVKKQGPDRLISLNEEYDDIYPGENDYTKCCGKVIGILKPEWILE